MARSADAKRGEDGATVLLSLTLAVLALLPKAESRKVREAMNSLGALQLREIDEAKETVAHASLEVVDAPIPNAA